VFPSVASALGPAALLKVVGGLGLAWLAMWIVVGKEIPHRESVIPLAHDEKPRVAHAKGRPSATPWKEMMASSAVWAIVINNFAFHYGFYVVMNWLPTYFNSLLKVELSSLGSLKTLPYLMMFLTSNVGGWAGDWLIISRKYSVAAARKTVNTVGMLTSAVSLLLMPSPSSVAGGIAVTTLTLGTLGTSRGGFSVNHMDIAPKYAGVIMGISNTAGTLAGVIGVAVTGRILDAGGGAGEIQGWWSSYMMCAAICVAATLIFVLFARGKRLFD